ncbi:NAD-dependent epimerase [Pseudomonas sichuanensis]|uniref:NAD-dependent epimerase n=1 Tax=Pseudomonas sichuanensis TaxID=2213015 RepID=UPI002447B041|nr:NAD-dependent epimerase [Pseudomonas sichuanensis]MDH0729750.1 NAD-dependent epimerase [Pseudomonas sichuanensis]MDH1582528.1 NAD-dependent epimerase [Pseudomonas sichuanensis]MDH1593905.1 NAD-dependent epimerase [Pseudomonas sichuanensis]MDH1597521.1 NAD-dependent epimerase [Pseudomonas sichuanensis]
MPVLITGAAGFIGFHLAQRLCQEGLEVVGIDNLNDYYSVQLKQARLQQLAQWPNFRFQRLDIADSDALLQLFARQPFSEVIHLAAQAGVRYSLDNPKAYGQANLVGFLNILEACRWHPTRHLIYASSSSVYGANAKLPFSVEDPVEQPVSLYAASKRANELMAHTYAHLYRIPVTGLRFFTVYGPWGRPDMALFKFTQAMLEGRPIEVYNHGRMARDFTCIDDIVESIQRLRGKPPQPAEGQPPCQLFNIGRGQPVRLLHFVECLEQALGIQAARNYLPFQDGDVHETWADISSLAQWIDYTPKVSIEQGVSQFVSWYRDFYRP